MMQCDLNMPWKWTLEKADDERNPLFDQIAQAACKHIAEKSTVYINSGTTGNMMVKYLPNIEFTLVTNSTLIANAAYKKCSFANIIVIGGKMRVRGVCDDDVAYQQLSAFEYDICFLTGEGFSTEKGLTNSSRKTAELHRMILGRTHQKILLLPYFKIGHNGDFKVADASQIDILITNRMPDSDCNTIIDLKNFSSLSIEYV